MLMTLHVPILLCALLAMQTPAPPAAPAQPPVQKPEEKAEQKPDQKPDQKPEQKPDAQKNKPTVELLTPTPLDVTTTNGVGAMPFRVLITGAVPDITKIDATVPSGDGQAFVGSVTVQVEASTPLQENQKVQPAVLTVKAAKPMPQGVKFSGLLIVPGLGRLPYSITDKTNVVLTASPDKIGVTFLIWQSDLVRLQVRNAGTSSFALTGATLSLEDAGSKRRVEETVTTTESAQTIAPGQSRQISMTLPRPWLAGTYAGSLSLRSDTDSLAVPVTITTRGPAPYGYVLLPAVLFVLTVIGGIWASSRLERFFGDGGGLRRAETVVALGTLENALERVRTDLESLAQNTGLSLPIVLARFSPLRLAVRDARTIPNTPNIETLMTEARAAQVAGMLLVRLLAAGVPPLNADVKALNDLSLAIEALPWPTDETSFGTFNTNVRAAIKKAHDDLIARTQQTNAAALQANQPAPAQDPGPLMLPPGTPTTVGGASDQITRMTYFQNALIWLVTVLTAYQTFYAADADFGTLANYIALFMWSLGITQAGTQIVTHARRPAN
jgi:hypothetical protein